MGNEIKFMIDKYFDGELEKQKEAFLFIELSRDEFAREYFKQMNSLKTAAETSSEEFPQHLEEKILRSVINKKETPAIFGSRKIFTAVSYTLTIAMLVISFFLYNQTRNYQSSIESINWQIDMQSRIIQTLMNSLPPVEVNPKYENTIVIKANM
ncbi:MAG: hypothetical protein HYS25_05430 [Ignavibacteriales bacterium]|nr:hypothetical protein [Ignavibacteriales bacterium]